MLPENAINISHGLKRAKKMERDSSIAKQKSAVKALREYPTEWTYYSDDRPQKHRERIMDGRPSPSLTAEEKAHRIPGEMHPD